jgi:hypothetical protein
MTPASLFDWISDQVEQATNWSRLEARGTVRLALKELGLDPRTVRKREVTAAVRIALGPALMSRRVTNASAVCEELIRRLEVVDIEPVADSPEEIFRRIAR